LGSPALEYVLIVCFRTELDQNDLYYSMKKTDRGLAIIFSHEIFDEIDGCSVKPRDGTVTDVERLSSTFFDLGFKIDLQENRTHKQIMDHISQGTPFTTYLPYMREEFVVLGILAFLLETQGVPTEVCRVSTVFTCKCQ
jgi:hypothetical protein